MRFARKKSFIVTVAAFVVLLSGCQGNVTADTVLSGRIITATKSIPLDGKFVVEDGCVFVQMQDDGETYPVIWPEGSKISAQDPSRVALPNGSVSLNQKPENFEVAVEKTESLAGHVQRGAIDGWKQCIKKAGESTLVLKGLGDIMLQD